MSTDSAPTITALPNALITPAALSSIKLTGSNVQPGAPGLTISGTLNSLDGVDNLFIGLSTTVLESKGELAWGRMGTEVLMGTLVLLSNSMQGNPAAGYGNGTGTSTSVQVFEGVARDLKGHLLRGLAPVVTTIVMMPLYE